MTKSKLKNIYQDLQLLTFPKSIENDDVADWISELAETDGFYAGLALSLLKGKKIKIKKFPLINNLFEDLEKLKEKLSEEQFSEYKNYLFQLEKLAKAIQEQSKRQI